MPRLTEYELERQANIERNQLLLKSLGIFHAEVAPTKAAKAKVDAKENKKPTSKTKKRPRASEGPAYPAPRRKSARLAGSGTGDHNGPSDSGFGNLNSDPIDFLSHPSRFSPAPSASPVKRAVVLRRLSPILPEQSENEEEERVEEEFDSDYRAPLPTRDFDKTLRFKDAPHFTPNMMPEEVLRAGSFGGTAFRRHYSTVLKRMLPETDYTEFPESWYVNLDTHMYLTAEEYDARVNRYRVRAGQSLEDWERAGWVHEQDPRGWFQWYARFYLGRRTRDDERQIRRWTGVCGSTGRFKRSLVKKIAERSGQWDDESISPILRQTLQHWSYRLTEEDYQAYF
ncbi:hypothetical protein M0805_004577 [Coniferiporia weirii]|nr:hypothetical protein M0805_004577 [Coniferiporia weirii]